MVASASLIAVDWGSTNFRAFLLNNNQIIEHIETDEGILSPALQSSKNTPADIFIKHCQHWINDNVSVLMSGMVGSKNGWQETSYLQCPSILSQLSAHLVPVQHNGNPVLNDISINIVPGLSGTSPNGSLDVMRGEEVQMLGALIEHSSASESALLCLPGTHSKWVDSTGETVSHFSTFMSGEIFNLLRESSSISALIEHSSNDTDIDVFIAGVDDSHRKGGLLHQLFSIRAQSVLNKVPTISLSSYLSGIIIGNEISEALSLYSSKKNVVLIGNNLLSKLYGVALKQFDIPFITIDGDKAFLKGITTIESHRLNTVKKD